MIQDGNVCCVHTVRGMLKSWTKLWCVLKPGVILLYKSDKGKV